MYIKQKNHNKIKSINLNKLNLFHYNGDLTNNYKQLVYFQKKKRISFLN